MSSPGGLPLWYDCIEPKYRDSIDERMREWTFGGLDYTFKATYDALWVANGGTVLSGDYTTALDVLDSFLDVRQFPVIGFRDVVVTPIPILSAYEIPWFNVWGNAPPCPLLRGV